MEKIVFSIIYKNTPIMNVEGLKLPFTIGSGDSVNLKIKEASFADQHIAIQKSGNNIVVRDLSGAHSLNLNGQPLNEFVVMDMEAFSVNDILFCEIGYTLTEEKTDEDPPGEEFNDFETKVDEVVLNSEEVSKVYELSEEEKTAIMTRIIPLVEDMLGDKPKQLPINSKESEAHVDLADIDGKIQTLSTSKKNSIVHFEQSPMLDSYQNNPKLNDRIKALEANLYWKGKLLQSKQLDRGDKLVIGPGSQAGLEIPQLKNYREVAQLLRSGLKMNVASNFECKILGAKQGWGDVESDSIYNKGLFSLAPDEFFVVKIDEFSFLYLRLIPTTQALTDQKSYNKDLVIWEVFLSSGFVHILLLLLAVYFAPVPDNVPELKNVPKRFAKLLVKKTPPPKPKVKEPEPPKPPKAEEPKPKPKKKVEKPKKVVKKKKVVRKAKKVVVKKTENMKKLNKYPLKLKSRTVKPSNKKQVAKDSSKVTNDKVKSMGALGALLATSKPNTEVASVNIDKNAGGAKSKANTNDIMAKLKSKNGKLAPGGTNRVATKGAGVGDGSSYGVQGLGGSAGAGAVQGSLGRPEVASFSKSDGLNPKQVMSVVNKYIGEIQRCYEKALISSTELAGRVEYEWTIEASGIVSSARVKKAELKGDGSKLNSCVLKVIRTMKFPKAKNGESTSPNIGFPFGRY